jgi:mannosyl-oligosaccharide alpha-1,2-mannosidase
VLESNFYAWRVTGNSTYLERAQSAIASFDKYLDTSTGYSGIGDVNDPNSAKVDETACYWFSEVLKYL